MTVLSVLDQSPIRHDATPAMAVHETLKLAQVADRLGYHRYWLAEHHSSAGLAGSAPEVLIGQVASRTSRIRVGSGGVMLSHYSPLKVAENFRMLETLFPGRIDLGIGRAPGSDYLTAQALAAGPGALSPEYFSHQVKNLDEYLHDEVPVDHPFEKVHAEPLGGISRTFPRDNLACVSISALSPSISSCTLTFLNNRVAAAPAELRVLQSG